MPSVPKQREVAQRLVIDSFLELSLGCSKFIL